MIYYEKEVCEALRLPSIPVKQWNGKSAFKNCVAVVKNVLGELAYAVASYDPEKDREPRVTRVFGQNQFTGIEAIYIVPEYMDIEDLKDADLDEESKRRAAELAKEAREIEDEGVDEGMKIPDHEYFFPQISSDEEAAAFIKSYNRTNKIRGKIPTTHEGLVMRLSVIYAETNKQ